MIQHIAVGIIKRNSSFLVCRRPLGKIMAGFWEFPGGKREKGETSLAALKRELNEELNIKPLSASFLLNHYYEYYSNSIQLEIWQIKNYSGIVQGREGQQIIWCPHSELLNLNFLPANLSLIYFIKHYFTL